jgi:hypothetical protein
MSLAYSYVRFSSAKQRWVDSMPRDTVVTERFCGHYYLAPDASVNPHDLGVSAFRGQNLVKEGAASSWRRMKEGDVSVFSRADKWTRHPKDASGCLQAWRCYAVAMVLDLDLDPGHDYVYARTVARSGTSE